MRAFILAAGRGERLRPLTDNCPKPLLPIHDKPLIIYHLEALQALGVREVVINTHYLAEQFKPLLGDGAQWDMRIYYSHEQTLLDSGGGIYAARHWLGDAPFILLNGDIFTDYPLGQLPLLKGKDEAHLVCVPKGHYHEQGDFDVVDNRLVRHQDNPYLYAGIALLTPALFKSAKSGPFSIVPLYLKAMAAGRVSAEVYEGLWADIGTPQRYAALNASALNKPA